ncbi:hypothetical protein HMPREF0293_0094 [Corynebacterium glucuronolyticum ATCC 51866]|nr:hypothetical protein HMPREF0293_0094 [Corynebacterium glucuronolyticum ATCC 51866]
MPVFWTDEALQVCQQQALRSTAIWTSALKELPDMASAVVWERMNPRLHVEKELAAELGLKLSFAVTDLDFLRGVIGTPDYSRTGFDRLMNKMTKVPVGNVGRVLNGISGYAVRACQEYQFVIANYPRILMELSGGCLVSEGVIERGRLEETFSSLQNVARESFFIFRNLELELWLKGRR